MFPAAVGHEKTCIDTQINNKKIELYYNCGRRQEFSSQSFVVRDEFFKKIFFISFLYNFNNDAYGTFSLVKNRQLSSSYGLLGVHPIVQQAFIDT